MEYDENYSFKYNVLVDTTFFMEEAVIEWSKPLLKENWVSPSKEFQHLKKLYNEYRILKQQENINMKS